MEIKGVLVVKFDKEVVTESFIKREFILQYAENPQYPELIKFELIQDDCDKIDQFEPGQELTVAFNLKGRKWTDPQGVVKYFNSLQAWKIIPVASQSTPAPQKQEPQAGSQEEPEWLQSSTGEGDPNDLPF